MTSNQVAAAMNQETIRHNTATEEETNRHNVATEELQAEINRLTANRDSADKTYKEESLRIQEAYNNAYLEWQKASGTRKLEIEAEMANIKQQEVNNSHEWNEFMEMYNSRIAEIQQQIADETARSNVANEELKSESNYLTKRYQDYQNAYWTSQITLGNLNAIIDMQKNAQTYELGSLGLQRDLAALERDRAELALKQEMIPWQKAGIILQGSSSLLGGFSKAFSPALPFLLNPWR